MNNWGDTQEEIKEKVFHIGPMINFKSMSALLQEMTEYIGEPNEEYPKKELKKLWVNLMIILLVLFTFSRKIFIVITIPFCFFYGFVLINLYQAWKNFKYSRKKFLFATVIALVVVIVAAVLLGELIFQ